MASVMAGPVGVGEQTVKQIGAPRRDFVQAQTSAAGLDDRGEQTGAGRRLQDPVSGADPGGQDRERGQMRRGGELVQGDLCLAASGLGQTQRRDGRQQGGDLRRRIFQTPDLGRQAPDLQNRQPLTFLVSP